MLVCALVVATQPGFVALHYMILRLCGNAMCEGSGHKVVHFQLLHIHRNRARRHAMEHYNKMLLWRTASDQSIGLGGAIPSSH